MKKRLFSVVSILLCLSLLLSGCGLLRKLIDNVKDAVYPSFEAMPYTRPELAKVESLVNQCITLAEEGNDLDALVNQITLYSMESSSFMTNYSLAYIPYSLDSVDEK